METHNKIIIILCLIAFISLAFLPKDNPQLEKPERIPNFTFIENTDEMEPTPGEIYIGIDGHLYMVNTETMETKLIY